MKTESVKFLSDVLNVEDLHKNGNKICIVSGVGSGKNYFVENKLTEKGNVLLITSRKAVKDEIILDSESKFIPFHKAKKHMKQNIVMTHAQLYKLIRESVNPKELFGKYCNFDYIVIDEAHCFVSDGTFTDSAFHLWEFAESVKDKSTVILMSATIPSIERKITKMGYVILRHTDDCRNVKPQNVRIISKEQAIKILQYTSPENKAIYMATSATGMVKITRKKLIEKKVDSSKIACVMSDQRVKDLLADIGDEVEKSQTCYKEIVERNILPKEIEIVFTTSKLKEGVNIEDEKIKMAFVESHNEIDIKQFSGRLRTGVETLYIIHDAEQHRNYRKYREIDYDFSEKVINVANEHLNSLFEVEYCDNIEIIYGVDAADFNFYCDKDVKEFVDYIEDKFEFLRFNHFNNNIEAYEQRKAGFDDHELDLRVYDEDNIVFLKQIMEIDDVVSNIIDAQLVIDEYLIKENVLDKKLNREQVKKILEDLTEKGIVNIKNKPYVHLGDLLKRYKYVLQIVGNRNDGIRQIIKK